MPWHATCDACSAASPAVPPMNAPSPRQSAANFEASGSRNATSSRRSAPLADSTSRRVEHGDRAFREQLAAPSVVARSGACSSTAHERSCRRSELREERTLPSEARRFAQTLPAAPTAEGPKLHEREDSARNEGWHAGGRRPGEAVIVDALLTEVRVQSLLLGFTHACCPRLALSQCHLVTCEGQRPCWQNAPHTWTCGLGGASARRRVMCKSWTREQVKSLKQQIAEQKHRELLLELRSLELERERDSMRALWEAEKDRQTTMHKAMASAMGAMGLQQQL